MMKTSPGLSAYADNPLAAYESIKPLLLYASLNIPLGKHKETPLYILCTAGMRLLPEEKRNNIMNVVASNIQQNFDFFFQSSHLEVIDGRMEGVYGWIAVNYMLGKFDHTFHSSMQRPTTVGALDMGGASTQITYEVPLSEELPSDLSIDIDLGCDTQPGHKSHTYHLYATTFLGFGANEARKRYVDLLVEGYVSAGHTGLLDDPCLPKGMQETQTSRDHQHVTLRGLGNFTNCRLNMYPLLKIPTTCRRSPCSMNGVFQPPINFYKQEMYGFSEYWYTMDDILKIGGHYREENFIRAATDFCATDWNLLDERFKSGEWPTADQHRFQYQCFKSAWVLAVLHDGHRFPSNYKNFISAKTVNREVIQWTYGAMIYLTRYLPLRGEGINKVHGSRTVPKTDVITQYLAITCFAVVLLAILYWMNKLRKLRSGSYLPSTLNDLSDPHHWSGSSQDGAYGVYTLGSINFNDVCATANGRGCVPAPNSGLPRVYSDSLLSRDMGGFKNPIFLGDQKQYN